VRALSLTLSSLYTSAYLDCFIATKIARIIKPAITAADRYSPRVMKKNSKNRHMKKIMIAAITREVACTSACLKASSRLRIIFFFSNLTSRIPLKSSLG